MKIIRWPNPLDELMGLRKTFKNFLSDDFYKEGRAEMNYDFAPAAEVREEDDRWNLAIELPGLRKGDIKIEFEENLLKITGTAPERRPEKEKNYFYTERKYGTFLRTFEVPENVNSEAISAEFQDGILNVSIPKAEKPKETKKIEIK